MEKTAKPVAAGVLIIITGLIGLMWSSSAFVAFYAMTISLDFYIPFFPEFVSGVILTVAIISLLFSLMVLISGIYRRVLGMNPVPHLETALDRYGLVCGDSNGCRKNKRDTT